MRFAIALLLLLSSVPRIKGPGGPAPAVVGPPTIRGSNQATSTATSTTTVTFPAGTVAGDLAILFAAGAWNITVPGGWTQLYLQNGISWNGMAASKVLSSGDISTGSVTVTFSNTFDAHLAIVTFVGGTSGVRETQGNNSGGAINPPNLTNTTTGAVQSTDTGVYFGTCRNSSTSLSITPGSGSANTLQSFSTTNAKSLLADQYMGGGVQTNTFTFGTGSQCANGVEAIQVIVHTP